MFSLKRVLLAVMILAGSLALLPAAPAVAADPPKGSVWTQHFIPSGDGITTLHADVLRPANIPEKKKTPVILTVSPYLNHAGETTGYSPNASGPSSRFYDFLDETDILSKGYTYVMVDLPGFGGSGGCNDWGGLREQGAVKAAVEWAASQPWSTGKVGMMGKSYDAWTGLMGMAQKPKGLAAVVAMEPVYSGYRYGYNNGVRFLNSVATPAGFQVYDAKPGSTQDEPQYLINSAPMAYCYPLNLGLQQQDEESAAYWDERNLVTAAKGSKVPLFMTQGFLETNTKPDAAFDFFNNLKGPNRAWYGQFDHVRGWEREGGPEGRFQMGRSVFVKEMMRFFDYHVKGVSAKKAPVKKDPNIAVQDALGRYRAEKSWPPKDSKMQWTKLKEGTYADDNSNASFGTNGGRGIWTISKPLKHDAWLAGEPVLDLKVNAVPRSNVVGNVYDVDPKGKATVISRGAFLVRGAGSQEVKFDLYGQDWPIKKGHRIGVLVSGSNNDWWVHVPTRQTVTVESGRIGLPFLKYKRTRFLDGGSTPRLESHRGSAYTTVTSDTIEASEAGFTLPAPLQSR